MNKNKLRRKINFWLTSLEQIGIPKKVSLGIFILAIVLPVTSPFWFLPLAGSFSPGEKISLTPTVTPSPTSEPTATPWPTEKPKSSKKVIPKAKATVTPNQSPTNTPEPTEKPSDVPPTETPKPEPTVTATPAPTVTETPSPTG